MSEKLANERHHSRALSPGEALFGGELTPEREKMVDNLLLAQTHPWRLQAEIIVGYARREKQKIVIRFRHNKDRTSYLRYSAGPGAGYFWDMGGDDFLNIGFAFRALQQAHRPPGLAWKREET